MTSLFHMTDGAVLQGGLAVSVVVASVLCIVLVQGCEVSLVSSLFHGFLRGWRDGPGSWCVVVGLASLQLFFSQFWLSQYSSVSLAVGLTKEHLADDQVICFFDLLFFSDLLHYCWRSQSACSGHFWTLWVGLLDDLQVVFLIWLSISLIAPKLSCCLRQGVDNVSSTSATERSWLKCTLEQLYYKLDPLGTVVTPRSQGKNIWKHTDHTKRQKTFAGLFLYSHTLILMKMLRPLICE